MKKKKRLKKHRIELQSGDLVFRGRVPIAMIVDPKNYAPLPKGTHDLQNYYGGVFEISEELRQLMEQEIQSAREAKLRRLFDELPKT